MIWAQVDPATASAFYSPTISLGAAHDIRERGAAHQRELLATVGAYRLRAVSVHGLTSSPRLKPGDSNPFMLRVQRCGYGAVIPCGFLLVPASTIRDGPRAGQDLHRL